MRLGAQIFEAVTLFLQRIVAWRLVQDLKLLHADLKGLLAPFCEHDCAFCRERAADGEMACGVKIRQAVVVDELDICQRGAVVQRNKAEAFLLAVCAHPAVDSDALFCIRCGICDQIFKQHARPSYSNVMRPILLSRKSLMMMWAVLRSSTLPPRTMAPRLRPMVCISS